MDPFLSGPASWLMHIMFNNNIFLKIRILQLSEWHKMNVRRMNLCQRVKVVVLKRDGRLEAPTHTSSVWMSHRVKINAEPNPDPVRRADDVKWNTLHPNASEDISVWRGARSRCRPVGAKTPELSPWKPIFTTSAPHRTATFRAVAVPVRSDCDSYPMFSLPSERNHSHVFPHQDVKSDKLPGVENLDMINVWKS